MAKGKGSMKGHTIKGGHKRPTKKGAGMTKKGIAKYRRDNPWQQAQRCGDWQGQERLEGCQTS